MNAHSPHLEQLAENLRFYSDMRFKQLTLLLAWLAVAAAGVAQFGTAELVAPYNVRQVLAAASLLFTAVLWVMEVRVVLYARVHRREIPDLWPRPAGDFFSPWLNATTAVLVLYAATYLFWLWSAVRWSAPWWLWSLGLLLFVALVIFSIFSYWGKDSPPRPTSERNRKVGGPGPATRLTLALLILIAFLHLVRLIVGIDVTVSGAALPPWLSWIAMFVAAVLALGLWREQESPPPAA